MAGSAFGGQRVSGRPRRKGLETTIPDPGVPPSRNLGSVGAEENIRIQKRVGCLVCIKREWRGLHWGVPGVSGRELRKGLQTTIPDLGRPPISKSKVYVLRKTYPVGIWQV